MFRVLFRSVVMMIGGVQRMAVRDFRVMRGLFVMPCLMMLCRLAMMLCCFVVVMRGFLVMLVDVVIHDLLLGWGCCNIAVHRETFATSLLQKERSAEIPLQFVALIFLRKPVSTFRNRALCRKKRAHSVDNKLNGERRKQHAEQAGKHDVPGQAE